MYPAPERPFHQNERKRPSRADNLSIIKIDGIERGFNQLRIKTFLHNIRQRSRNKRFKTRLSLHLHIRKSERKAAVFQARLSAVIRIHILSKGTIQQPFLQRRTVMTEQYLFQKQHIHQPVNIRAFGQQPVHGHRELIGIFALPGRSGYRNIPGRGIRCYHRNKRRFFRRFKKAQKTVM